MYLVLCPRGKSPKDSCFNVQDQIQNSTLSKLCTRMELLWVFSTITGWLQKYNDIISESMGKYKYFLKKQQTEADNYR